MDYHSSSAEDVIKELGTDEKRGLTSERVSALQAQFGPNKLDEKKKKPLIVRFLEQFKDVMIIILLIAAVISFGVACYQVFGTKEGEALEFVEPALIVFIVILNAVMGLVQESKAEKALEALKNMSAPHARVLRDGKEQIVAASALVPGDIIFLEAGDFVPADARLLESTNLKSEESALTGESVPSEKDAREVVESDAPIGDRSNMVFTGCSVTYGTATAVVTGTGMKTEMGKIAEALTQAQKEDIQQAGRIFKLGDVRLEVKKEESRNHKEDAVKEYPSGGEDDIAAVLADFLRQNGVAGPHKGGQKGQQVAQGIKLQGRAVEADEPDSGHSYRKAQKEAGPQPFFLL